MAICIICREEKTTFSDEHVIPDSLNGYYHIYSVCADCNPELGSRVDSKLVNHKFMEFQRHQLNIRGKKGGLPNPLSGIGILSDDPEQKVRMEMDDKGNFKPRLLPKVSEYAAGSSRYRFSIDKRDAHLKDGIIDKLLQRNGLHRSQVDFQEEVERETRSEIQSMLLIDVKDFRIGMLKIAYEFTVDCVPEYFHDETAVMISKILHRADVGAMDKSVRFFGSGFDKKILKPLAYLIEFDNNNHYLILMEVEGIGLVCTVNLFHSFSIAVLMSPKAGYLRDTTVIGINDFEKRSFEKIDTAELMRRTHSPTEYGFQFFFATLEEALEFQVYQTNNEIQYVQIDGSIPFYDRAGNVRYPSINDKLNQPQLDFVNEGDGVEKLATRVELDEELFVLLNPGMRLVQVVAVRITNRRLTKL